MSNLKSALNCDRSVFIQACAGAGKTFALTKRYAAILDRFAQEAASGTPIKELDHKKILVITFTKKAAGEMSERIYKDVNVLLSGDKPKGMEKIDFCPTLRTSDNEAVKKFTKNLKETFSQNSISTIDSFCAGILREFAHRIDLDPQFISQDEGESKKLLDESLEKWLRGKIKNKPDSFDLLLEDLTFYHIRQAMKNMYHSREVLDTYVAGIENKDDEDIWRDWLIHYTPSGEIENLVATFKALWKSADILCEDHNDAMFKGLQDMQEQLQKLDKNDPIEYRAAFLSEVVRNSMFVTRSGAYLRQKKGSKGNWSDGKAQAEGWFELLQQTVPINELQGTPGQEDKKVIPLLKQLISHYRDFDQYYLAIRKKRNVLNFSDIILFTHHLISKFPDIRKQMGARYSHIMLDEFQDTNPLRWEIIKAIFESANDTKLFIVGDRKQSIYRFNNADVTVMNTAQKLIENLNGESLDFNDNYRSSKEFAEKGINDLIKMIMPSNNNDIEKYEASFIPTEAKTEKKNIIPAVETHWCSEPENRGDENISALHAAYQVKRLLEKYQGSEIDEEGKPLIGVLLRRFTKIADYLQAFRQLDIPISIIGGKGFYETPACRDIFHFLSVMDNPYDDHALVGLLRSPFIAMSDPDIHLLSKREKDTSLYEAMNDHADLQPTRKLIDSWILAAGKTPLDELLGKILDSDDRELAYVSELLPEQQLANLDKAINIIRGMQRSGSSLRMIREFFAYQMTQKTSEAQAIYPGTAKVHLLTVHKAKGLGFPIVVLPEMNHGGKSSNDNIRYGRTHDHAEISLSLPDQDKPGILRRLKDITDNEETAEDKRVFYVALTRSIYKVCFLGEGKKSTKNTWWEKYVLEPQGLIETSEPEEWPHEQITQHLAEDIMQKKFSDKIGTLDWIEAPKFEMPGKYLYRTPHDLMGNKDKFKISAKNTGLGAAPGSLYHYCMEQGWFESKSHYEDIKTYIHQHFPTLKQNELINKLDNLLEITRKNSIFKILNDPDVEKYNELSLKAWLRKDQDIVQVNGTIDLLYREDNTWTIVDFKTDSTKNQKEAYKKQIQSYQWMLKQIYNIDAKGKIFFVSLNEYIDVNWNDNYFDTLPIGSGYRPILPVSGMKIDPLIKKIEKGENLLFCASAHHEEKVYLALVNSGCMRPDIQLTTINKWLRYSTSRTISQDRLRLMLQNEDKNIKQGSADYLASAFRDMELEKCELRKEFEASYHNISLKPSYIAANDPYKDPILLEKIKDQRIGFIDLPPLAPLEDKLLREMRSIASCFDCSFVPEKLSSEVKYIEAFSPREEVLAVAKHIQSNTSPEDDILITVSSMDKYAPHLQRIFPQLGLQVRFTDPRSLLESPYTSLLLNVLQICNKPQPEWNDLSPILFHPLCEPDIKLFLHDKDIRSNPLKEFVLFPKAQEFIKEYHCHDAGKLSDKLEAFIKKLEIEPGSEAEKVCDKFMSLLLVTIADLELIYGDHYFSMIYQEMSTRIQKEGIPRRDQQNGIPVVGFLDSLGMVPDKLYILGMVEGDIPRPEKDNPYSIPKAHFSLELNRYFMQYWLSLGERIIFSASMHGEDGSEQNRSSFLEGLDLRYLRAEKTCRRDTLLQFDGHDINEPKMAVIHRHNEIISGKKGIYSGWIDELNKKFKLYITDIDTLLACPMKLYFSKILNIDLMDQDEQLSWVFKRGNVVHKALEYFANEGGFILPIDKAITLLEKNIQSAFNKENIDPGDPFQQDRFRNYIRDLNINSETNCLVLLLKKNKEVFANYKHIETEKPFNDFKLSYDGVEVYLSGRIDKLMIDKKEKRLIISDYKTGNIKTSNINKKMLSQLYLYLQKCKEDYPDYELMAIYEQIKDTRNTKILKFVDNDDNFTQIETRASNSFNIEEFEYYLGELFLQIADGKYYITDRPYKDTCEYCPHAGLCRKDTRLKLGTGN